MELYFTDPTNISETEAVFDSFESQHVLRTMRKKEGDSIEFTDGRGTHYIGEITASRPHLRVSYRVIRRLPWPPPGRSILGIGFIRHSRMDFMIEKATELGINHFYLFASRYTNYFTKNSSRWEKITRQAIKQSNRLYLPEITIMPDYKTFLKSVETIRYKFLADQSAELPLHNLVCQSSITAADDILFSIGPEGGFDESEISLALSQGFSLLSFGDSRLRTETAAISAASYINLLRH